MLCAANLVAKSDKERDAENAKGTEVRGARVVHECDFFKNTNTH